MLLIRPIAVTIKLICNRAKHFDEGIMSPRLAAEDITAPV